MNATLNKKYLLEMTVLSPLHVGAGVEKDWVEGIDFVQKDGKVFKLNFNKVTKSIGVASLSAFLINKDSSGLISKLSGNLEDYAEKTFILSTSSTNDIKAFFKNGLNNRPVVPGSSLKGAIRSVLFNYLRTEQKTDKDVFGTANMGDEFMRFIKVSDADFESTILTNTKIFNLFKERDSWYGGWKHKSAGYDSTDRKFNSKGFNTIYEIIRPGEKGNLSIALSIIGFKGIKNHIFQEKKEALLNGGITKLFEIINKHTKSYITKEISFFNKYENNETGEIINNLNEIRSKIPSDSSSCILKMSAGSGFHSITGDWQYNTYDLEIWNKGRNIGKKKYKSRKIATDGKSFAMMGFVSLTLKSEETIEKERVEKQKLKEQKRIEVQMILEAERERINLEQLEKDREEREERERIEEENKRDEEEKRKIQEIRELIEKEKQDQENREKINKQKKEIEKEKLVSKGLSHLLKNFDDYETGKNKIADFKRTVQNIPVSENLIIYEFLERCYKSAKARNESLKAWQRPGKGHWSLIKSWVGHDTAKEWYEKIINR